jgi:hypothetical protein
MKNTFFCLLITLIFSTQLSCKSTPTHVTTASDSTELAKAYNQYFYLKTMSNSQLMEFAKASSEPIHSFTRREQFLEFQKHYYDSLRWIMK